MKILFTASSWVLQSRSTSRVLSLHHCYPSYRHRSNALRSHHESKSSPFTSSPFSNETESLLSPIMSSNSHPTMIQPPLRADPRRPVTPPPEDQVSLRKLLQLSDTISETNNSRPHPPIVVGHRGAVFEALENTREGFLHCASIGCDFVELDVFQVQGELVVFHGSGNDSCPGSLVNYCVLPQDYNSQGQTQSVSIMDLTLDQCFELSFNTTYDGFPCPPEKIHSSSIPTLKDVLLDLKTTQTKIKIELKGPNTVEPTLKLIEELDMVHQCQYSSFQLDRLRLLRQLRPQRNEKTGEYVYATGALFGANVPSDYIERALSIGASQVHLRYDTCTVERVAAIRKAGLTSMVYFRGPLAMMMDAASFNDVGFEDERCYQALIDTGVDQLCVNRPDLLMRMVRSQYKNK